jgi:hypothetical protein
MLPAVVGDKEGCAGIGASKSYLANWSPIQTFGEQRSASFATDSARGARTDAEDAVREGGHGPCEAQVALRNMREESDSASIGPAESRLGWVNFRPLIVRKDRVKHPTDRRIREPKQTRSPTVHVFQD